MKNILINSGDPIFDFGVWVLKGKPSRSELEKYKSLSLDEINSIGFHINESIKLDQGKKNFNFYLEKNSMAFIQLLLKNIDNKNNQFHYKINNRQLIKDIFEKIYSVIPHTKNTSNSVETDHFCFFVNFQNCMAS
ncbi:hypothetical protein PsalMR5_04851 (plasmid) [Piscirickettsia salmonis]|nr:hypothetical protein [Piscirickettsia salmonis]QGP56875.1 hypothetical protein PsalSR1_04364 [Piscirickettsia salmonis]QGP62171.1 hypothetical protein PsalBI1_04813 [Piscirickettsia salmonis]QGP66926.1 hypothetical protein PsalMR5_04851 [Piscirickettsia salmonis]